MVLAIGFLLMVSLVISAVLSGLGNSISNLLPEGFSAALLELLNIAISAVVFTALFAAIFKILPDADVEWKDVWIGAAFTTALFLLGKFAIGLYLGNSNIGSAYGAAGSLTILLIWLYYSAMIFLIGAEFTQVWARRFGKNIMPSEGAVRVVQETVHVDERHGGQARHPKMT
jgi:membrane protein